MSDETAGRFTLGRLAVALVVISVAAAAGGAGTFAAFQDTESSVDNTVQAGTLDLTAHDSGQLYWEIGNAAPGETGVHQLEVNLGNAGTTAADHVEVDFNSTGFEDANGNLSTSDSGPESDISPNATGMGECVRIETLDYLPPGSSQVTDLLSQINDSNANGIKDLDDLEAPENREVLDDLSPPEKNGGLESELTIKVTVDESMGDAYQGDVLKTKITFSLHQDSSQNYP